MKRFQLTLTPAQLKTIRATPITLIPTPGPSKFINMDTLIFDYVFRTTPYTVPAPSYALEVFQGAQDTAAGILATGVLDQSASTLGQLGALGIVQSAATLLADQPITIKGQGGAGELTLGDGLLTVIVYYTIETETP